MLRGVKVRVLSWAQKIAIAEIAQLVEHNLAKVGVASPSLVFRSREIHRKVSLFFYFKHKYLSMSFQVQNPFYGRRKDELQIDATRFTELVVEQSNPTLPAEWAEQSGVQLTWPHADTDWAPMLDEVSSCFVQIAKEISRHELLLVVTPEPQKVQMQLTQAKVMMRNVRFMRCNTNDTWARDHGAITLTDPQGPQLLDFCFNGWGNKFAAEKDNAITQQAVDNGFLHGKYVNHLDFVLEGGSIESDGLGTLLTTSACLLNSNRNPKMNKVEIEEYLKHALHITRILWLDHGYLSGDDTDSHIDTLARFCSPDTIAYVKCDDPSDEHYDELAKMEAQLKTFLTPMGMPYNLLPLPMADKVVFEGERLPATYANFLILNQQVLYPTYNQPANDAKAKEILQTAFPGYNIVGIDCRPLIKQHGSLHCVTMQYPKNVVV